MPNLTFTSAAGGLPAGGTPPVGVTLAVYAPFGTDATLSCYPDSTPQPLQQHPLVLNLLQVCQRGVHVTALIDLHDDDTYLVDIPALKPLSMQITGRWKQDMNSPRTLAGFLRRARQLRPETAIVLGLEGHGAGFLPELDRSQLGSAGVTQDGTEWHLTPAQGTPQNAGGSPLLPMGCPLLPMGCPLLPANHLPLSTWGLGQALKESQGSSRKLGVLHFNNCFNMAVELLHTVAPHADVAAGYMNYNFFTAGEGYPAAFAKLQAAGNASTTQFAQWLAEANRDVLASKTHHPTTGGVVPLARLPGIAAAVHVLAQALTTALSGANADQRPALIGRVRTALVRAQQYDTAGNAQLDTPDELTDLCSLADQLKTFPSHPPVQAAALALLAALGGIKSYGATGTPWTAPGILWDFSRPTLAMNILCPDPLRRGLWDWRSPYYLQKLPSPAQPQVIDFLKNTAWIDFLIEYHRDAPFRGVLPAAIPDYPIFNRRHTLPPD